MIKECTLPTPTPYQGEILDWFKLKALATILEPIQNDEILFWIWSITLWKKEKKMVTSTFSIPHNVLFQWVTGFYGVYSVKSNSLNKNIHYRFSLPTEKTLHSQ